jgi:hypothetical protein
VAKAARGCFDGVVELTAERGIAADCGARESINGGVGNRPAVNSQQWLIRAAEGGLRLVADTKPDFASPRAARGQQVRRQR